MIVREIEVTVKREANVTAVGIRLMLKRGPEFYWRTWETKAAGNLSEDPVEAWRQVQAIVAALNPPPPNQDQEITHETKRLPSTALGFLALERAMGR